MIIFEIVEKTDEMLTYHYYPEDDRSASPGIIVVDKVRMIVEMRRPAEKDTFRPATEEEKTAMGVSINAMREQRGEPPLADEILAAMTKASGKYECLNLVMNQIAGAFYGGTELEKGTIE